MENVMQKIINEIRKDTIHITDNNELHSYIDEFYCTEFIKYKNYKIVLIEIGVHFGGSLKLWEKYFTNATLYGLDIICPDESLFDYFSKMTNVNYLIANAYDKTISNILPNYDIFIDDGPHTLESQLKSIDLYLPKMNDCGVFIIEDVATELNANILKNHIDIHYNNLRCNHICIIIVYIIIYIINTLY
jgi:hypothetical protein